MDQGVIELPKTSFDLTGRTLPQAQATISTLEGDSHTKTWLFFFGGGKLKKQLITCFFPGDHCRNARAHANAQGICKETQFFVLVFGFRAGFCQ